MRSEDFYQLLLIILGVIATVLFGIFVYREIFPEYKLYQNAYVQLEEFRSTYTGEPPPEFKVGVKQIVIPRDDKGPETIDRCISCHVALQYEHFSPTTVARDINGSIRFGTDGIPLKEANENYVWARLNQKIIDLRDENVLEHLKKEGNESAVKKRLAEAEELEALKTVHVDEQIYDMTKVLQMHPLIGKETRPFEFHPLETYGCTSCHNGNGRSLVTDRAHGAVFDGQYEEEYQGPKPTFLETDPDNDPSFAHVFNHKPGHRLLFQITPLFVGGLMEAKCVQCHQPTSAELQRTYEDMENIANRQKKQYDLFSKGINQEVKALVTLVDLRSSILNEGYESTLKKMKTRVEDPGLTTLQADAVQSQIDELQRLEEKDGDNQQKIIQALDLEITEFVGSTTVADQVAQALKSSNKNAQDALEQFLVEQGQKETLQGSLFAKVAALNLIRETAQHLKDTQYPLESIIQDESVVSGMKSDVDLLTQHYQKGKELYISQACYACHRIAGYARGGVGPELTLEGMSYPWFVKESLVWPQADLKTSTMPNMKLDHEELENLMTFLLAQRNDNKNTSSMRTSTQLKEWEEGKKQTWEEPLPPSQIRNVRNSMQIFVVEGCASCHRLNGFDSNVGFVLEKREHTPAEMEKEKEWFQSLFPEHILGSELVTNIEKNQKEIDKRLSDQVRENGLLEEIDKKHPHSIEALYSNFKFALRAKNSEYAKKAEFEKDPQRKDEILKELADWKKRVRMVLMMTIQEYGLGRQIGPKLNWSGVYRSDQWLMEHFWNPQSHIPRSIMPVFPFDDSKFQALTYMLDVLGQKNREEIAQRWKTEGFNPAEAVQLLCAQCHGDYLQGNGPVSEWIYPIPKNLKNAVFLRNLTKEQAIRSITHGVKGTPMPPWGETPEDKPFSNEGAPVLTGDQIDQLVDWLYKDIGNTKVFLPTQEGIKWQYEPEDVMKELQKEGDLKKIKEQKSKNPSKSDPLQLNKAENEWKIFMTDGEGLYAAINPMPIQKKNEEPLQDISPVFEIEPMPGLPPDIKGYYIKKELYTPENLKAGEDFFVLNCAVCHGKEGDGGGTRAAAMQDAKPRMLTNLNWIDSRDDLRLLRSIKYGVPGTSMTPWGDLTTSFQRLQLVMYIRSLTLDKKLQEELTNQLFQTFKPTLEALERARAVAYNDLEKTRADYFIVKKKRQDEAQHVERTGSSTKELSSLYENELELQKQTKAAEELDDKYTELIRTINKKEELYLLLGKSFIAAYGHTPHFNQFLELVAQENPFYLFDNGKIKISEKNEEKIITLRNQLLTTLQNREIDLLEQAEVLKGKKPTPEIKERLTNLELESTNQKKLTREFLSTLNQSEEFDKHANELLNQINNEGPR